MVRQWMRAAGRVFTRPPRSTGRLGWPERLHNRVFVPIVIVTVALGAMTLAATLITVTEGYRARLLDHLFSQERLTERVLHEIEEHLILYGAAMGKWDRGLGEASESGGELSIPLGALHSLAHDGMRIRYHAVASPDDPEYALMRRGHAGKVVTGLVSRETAEGDAYFLEAVVPIERYGHPEGYMVVALPLADPFLAELGGSPGADVSLVIGDRIVASTVRDRDITDAILTEADTPGMLGTVLGEGRHTTADLQHLQTPRRALFTPLVFQSEKVGMLVYSISLQPLIDARQRILYRGLPAIGVTVLLVVIIYDLFIRRVTKPIRQLAKATASVASGDLDVQLPITRPAGEIRVLTDAFTRMLVDLRTSRREAAEWRRLLEKRVAERTRQLKEAHAELVQAGKLAAIGELASGLAHEVRNPLAVIRMSARYLMKRTKGEEKTEQHLGMIHEEIDRLDKLITDLLGFARPATPVLRSTDVGRLFRRSLALADGEITARSIKTTVSVAPAVPPVMMDPDQMRQVLLNLILNACHAMPDGGDLVLSAALVSPGEKGTTHIRIEVTDTGAGIRSGDIEAVFTPFFTTKASGTGLGLAISQRIIRSHGGEIVARSRPGEGAAFIITLPVK